MVEISSYQQLQATNNANSRKADGVTNSQSADKALDRRDQEELLKSKEKLKALLKEINNKINSGEISSADLQSGDIQEFKGEINAALENTSELEVTDLSPDLISNIATILNSESGEFKSLLIDKNSKFYQADEEITSSEVNPVLPLTLSQLSPNTTNVKDDALKTTTQTTTQNDLNVRGNNQQPAAEFVATGDKKSSDEHNSIYQQLKAASQKAQATGGQQQSNVEQQNIANPNQNNNANNANNNSNKLAGFASSPLQASIIANDQNFNFSGNNNGYSADPYMQELGLANKATKTNGSGSLNFAQQLQDSAKPASQQLNIQIQKGVENKVNGLTVELHPAELGKLDVKLNIDDNGVLKASIMVEKPETLALLQKDNADLMKALQEAGIQTDEGSLDFNLKQQSGQDDFDKDQNAFGKYEDSQGLSNSEDETEHELQIDIGNNNYISNGGINVVV